MQFHLMPRALTDRESVVLAPELLLLKVSYSFVGLGGVPYTGLHAASKERARGSVSGLLRICPETAACSCRPLDRGNGKLHSPAGRRRALLLRTFVGGFRDHART